VRLQKKEGYSLEHLNHVKILIQNRFVEITKLVVGDKFEGIEGVATVLAHKHSPPKVWKDAADDLTTFSTDPARHKSNLKTAQDLLVHSLRRSIAHREESVTPDLSVQLLESTLQTWKSEDILKEFQKLEEANAFFIDASTKRLVKVFTRMTHDSGGQVGGEGRRV
jgi:hypothetical protein